MSTSRIITIVALASSLACGTSSPSEIASEAGGKGDSIADTGDWRQRIAAQAQQFERDNPEQYTVVRRSEPRATRPGFLRMRGADLRHASAAAVLLTRYLEESDAKVRAALVEALPRTGGQYADALTELYSTERDEEVRAAMMGALAGDVTATSLETLTLGLRDRSADVRIDAATFLARHPLGKSAREPLKHALGDENATVRAQAARALGAHGDASDAAALSRVLADADATVRLRALRSLARVDAQSLAPHLATLTGDEDERVRRAAAELSN